jgi:lipopolysaccharide/colanic/teichoic acid biosynthesis glycosyltransferase
MTLSPRREALILFLGDIACFNLALWPLLFFRYYGTQYESLIGAHIVPFSILFTLWAIVFFIAGLYEKHTVFFKQKLPQVLFNAQLVNAGIGVTFFYLVPAFGIAPRTNLFVYLVISSVLIFIWRFISDRVIGAGKREFALLIGDGEDVEALQEEINTNNRYSIYISEGIAAENNPGALRARLEVAIKSKNIRVVVADGHNPHLKEILPITKLMEGGIRFIDISRLYEENFDRVSLSLTPYERLLEDVSRDPHVAYDSFKRVMDIAISGAISIVSLVLFPLVYLLIKLDDGGPVFFFQERIGEGNRPIQIVKFRSMTTDGAEVTRVGNFLRKSRIDELPQLWNVLSGSLSLIGPRPELPKLVKEYESHIPYYAMRHMIKPGLSGWAQIYHQKHPHHQSDVTETKVKLSYDLYYLKHRSLLLDLKIALRTIQTLLSRSGI